MSHLTNLMIAVILAGAAALANMLWLNSQSEPSLFVSVSTELTPGDPITEASLAPIPVPGDNERLSATLIPWSGRATILDYPAPRAFSAGDLVFRQDIRPPSERLEIVGPFRVVGDKERLGREPSEGFGRNQDGIVMIAVSTALDEQTRALLQLLAPKSPQQAVERSILAVQVVPANAAAEAVDQQSEVVYQPVDLQGLENAPRDLEAGEFIRFVVAQ
jgi:hypothetical protein